jgi:hypothetical protein
MESSQTLYRSSFATSQSLIQLQVPDSLQDPKVTDEEARAEEGKEAT